MYFNTANCSNTDGRTSTGLIEVREGANVFTINDQQFDFYVPALGEGVVGTIIADPYFNNKYLSWCEFGDQF